MQTFNTLGERLSDLRKQRGEKQDDIKELLGVSRATVANYENGNRMPDYQTLVCLADHFGVTCDYLLRGVRSSFAEIHSTTGLSDKSIEILQNILKFRRRSYIDMLNFLIEETDFVLQDFGGCRFYNSTLKSMYEYFFFDMKNKEYIVSSNGAMIEVTDKNDEDMALVLSEIEEFGEAVFADDEYYDETEIKKVNSTDLFESFQFQNLTEMIKSSKQKYLKQKGEQHGDRSKKE